MTEPKFTKGPWTSSLMDYHSEDPTVIAISGSDNNNVCEILDGSVEDADLALILAAPDMYEALEEVIKIYNFKEMVRTDKTINSPRDDPDRGKIFFTYNDLSKARNALRKARGEAE